VPPALDGHVPPWCGGTAGGRPDHQMRRADRDHLLAPRAAIRLARSLARDAPDQKIPIARVMRFLSAEWGEPAFGGYRLAGTAPTSRTVPAHGTMRATGHPTTVTPEARLPDGDAHGLDCALTTSSPATGQSS
jgi:hypothetical protein